jgi:D-alanyl-D-alanine endopeptidase (penicillin-binding protein 7)
MVNFTKAMGVLGLRRTILSLAALQLLIAGPLTRAAADGAPGVPGRGSDAAADASSGPSLPSPHRARVHARHAHKASDQPLLRSGSVLVLDENSSSVLLSRHSDVAAPIASITKLMTALVVLDAGQSLDEAIEITRDDQDDVKGSTSRLAIGVELNRGDLVHLALMSSENRAAHAIGRSYPGGVTACVEAMNAKARALGMASARFVDPTGLSSGNVASPEDLSKLVIAASENPKIQQYSTDDGYVVPVGRRMLEFRNTDSLVSNKGWNIVVQKTGYIAEAGRCLVMKALIEGRSIVIVLLDSVGKHTRVADARRIKKWMESRRSVTA